MEQANITLNGSFMKSKVARNDSLEAKVKFKSKKEFELVFILDKKKIIVNSKNKKTLTSEERLEIIRVILEKYTTFINSIIRTSISYGIDTFVLVDKTSVFDELKERDDTINKDTILEEYVKSEYIQNSGNNLFKELKNVYDKCFGEIVNRKSKQISTPIKYKLKFPQGLDLRYYIYSLLKREENTGREFQVSVTKTLLNIKELD